MEYTLGAIAVLGLATWAFINASVMVSWCRRQRHQSSCYVKTVTAGDDLKSYEVVSYDSSTNTWNKYDPESGDVPFGIALFSSTIQYGKTSMASIP